MMKSIKFYLLCVFLFTVQAFAQKKKVACIGDSITWGSTITERERNSYPAYLQYLLGADYEVKNFGVPGATLLTKGDKPYVRQRAYKDALSYKADIVVIMLGTNDSKLQNFRYKSDFKKDYNTLIQSFVKRNKGAHVILMTPIVCTSTHEKFIHKDRVQKLLPLVKEVAEVNNLSLVDLQTPFLKVLDKKYTGVKLPDGIHPNSFGAELIAKETYREVTKDKNVNFATFSLPSMEYRGKPAGWGGGTWWNQLDKINQELEQKKDSINLVLFGDSITQNWTGSKKRMSNKNGNRPIDKVLSKYGAYGAGISGDRVEALSYRAEQHFKTFKPKYISIMIGVNNFLSGGNTGDEVGDGIVALINKLKKITPTSEIILFATFPNGRTKEHKRRAETLKVHQKISVLSKLDKVHLINLKDELLDETGRQKSKYFGKDEVHPKRNSTYLMWANKIDEIIKEIEK